MHMWCVHMMVHTGKPKVWLYVSHWCKYSYLALLHVKLFPTLWHSAALGLNREARCAPRMRVCRVPISEYTVIGLPEDPYLTFRLQVAGHFSAQPSSASAVNPFVAQAQHYRKTRDSGNHWCWCCWFSTSSKTLILTTKFTPSWLWKTNIFQNIVKTFLCFQIKFVTSAFIFVFYIFNYLIRKEF